jgi:hypothetical protein
MNPNEVSTKSLISLENTIESSVYELKLHDKIDNNDVSVMQITQTWNNLVT